MNKTYEFSQGIIRVVRVVVRDGHPSGKCARVGTDTVRLILEGDSAWIEGDKGRKKIHVVPTQQGDTSLLKARGASVDRRRDCAGREPPNLKGRRSPSCLHGRRRHAESTD